MPAELKEVIHIGMILTILMIITGTYPVLGANVELVNHLGGNNYDVALVGDFAYLGQEQDLVVLNIADKAKPLEERRITTPSIVYGIAVSGSYAYIANGKNGLTVLNINNVSSPWITGNNDTNGIAYDVEISGKYAFVITSNGLSIMDVNDPSSPRLVSSYGTNEMSSIAVSDGYAYVISKGDQNGKDYYSLLILNIADPEVPRLTGSYDIGEEGSVVVEGNYAYVSSGSGILIIDITDPEKIIFAGSCEIGNLVSDIVVSGNYAYLTGYSLSILDIKDPSAIALVGSHEIGDAKVVAVSDGHAYVISAVDGSSTGLFILDVTDPAAPAAIGSYSTTLNAYDIDASGNYAYIADYNSGLVIVNITDPSAVRLEGSIATAGHAYDITVAGNYAYIANSGLMILNITDPKLPQIESIYYNDSYDTIGVAVKDDHAYMASVFGGLLIIDTTDPSTPVYVGSYDTDDAQSVVISDNYAYIANGFSGLLILDITDPAAPAYVSHYDTAGYANDIAVTDGYACIADGSNGLVILDITDPASPRPLNTYGTAGYANDIIVADDLAYIAASDGGLIIVDISDPRAPVLAGSYATENAFGVTLSEENVLVADYNNGLFVLRLFEPQDTTPPAPVANLRESNVDKSWIKWTWTKPNDPDLSHAMIYIDNVFVTNTSDAFYNATGLAEGTTYTIGIKTVDTSGNINHNIVSGSVTTKITDRTPPATVTDLHVSGIGTNWVHWEWTNPTDADFSHVMVYIDGVLVTNTQDNHYNATGFLEGTVHTIGIQTVDTAGNINPATMTDQATTWTRDTTPPATVTDLHASSIGANWVRWAWTNPTDADFGHVRIYINGAFVTTTPSNSYNATGLSNGAEHTIAIETVDTSGNVNTTQVSDTATTLKLPVISNVAGRNIRATSITLEWDASEDTATVQISVNGIHLDTVNGSTYVHNDLNESTTYNYTLVPFNQNGLKGEAVGISLMTSSSEAGGGGGGSITTKSSNSGGSGGAGSTEDFENVELKDVVSIYLIMDTNAVYEFTKEGNPIQSISFYPFKNSGEIASTIEVLHSRSKLVISDPEDLVYKHINIWVGKAGFATEANIKDPKIKFKVDTSWIENMGVSPGDVRLQRYDGRSWKMLPTTLLSSSADYTIFEAETTGFSSFAITAGDRSQNRLESTSSEKFLNEPVGTETAEMKKTIPKKNRTWTLILIFLIAGIFAVGYEYLKK
ncbi:PGF-pre-PGF domain-containing protein [Methanomethylovorans sp.]|uniref:PGF-pre-PGF domain-containing protein n=1 Tax=Methanomethylovorans sp. TaxID=2758717 RepID=UPI00345EBAD0